MTASIGEAEIGQHLPISSQLWKKANDSSLSSMKEESVMTATLERAEEQERRSSQTQQATDISTHQRQSLEGVA